MTPGAVIGLFTALGIVFASIGAVILGLSAATPEFWFDYTDCLAKAGTDFTPAGNGFAWKKVGDNTCILQFTLDKSLAAPVFLYYRLTGFYQNNRTYVKSVNWSQLGGAALTKDQLDSCAPLIGPDSGSNLPYYPCGLIANSMFSDEIGPLQSGNTTYIFTDKGIAWSSDLSRFQPTAYSREQVLVPPAWAKARPELVETSTGLYRGSIPDLSQNERLMVWMRTAAFPSFRKTWGRLDAEVPAGTYTMAIRESFDVSGFKGTKTVILGKTGAIGGRNIALGIIYVACGALFLALALAFLTKQCIRPRIQADRRYLSWAARPSGSSPRSEDSQSPSEKSPEVIDPDALVEQVNVPPSQQESQTISL